MGKRIPRIVVCGTGFGHLWIDTIARYPGRYDLAAVVARGSAHSIAVCDYYRIPLLKSVASVEGHVDAAVVAIGGGEGEGVTREWLRKGVPVLLEHPVEPSFLSRIKANRFGQPRLEVNGHFADLPSVGEFIDVCRKQARAPEHYSVNILATPRTLYSCLDIALSLLSAAEVAKLCRVRLRLPESATSIQLGRLRLLVAIMPLTSEVDDAAGSIGGHLIEACFQEKRIVLTGPTGPIITLGARGPSSSTWTLTGTGQAVDWKEYSTVLRPAALIKALERILRPRFQNERVCSLEKDRLVSVVWRKLLPQRGSFPNRQ